MPERVTEEWKRKIKELDKKAKTDLEFVKLAYEYITGRFYVSRLLSLLRVYYAWRDPFSFEVGHVQCTILNYLLRMMLVRSGRFKEEDIRVETVPFNMWVHQYLELNVNNELIYVDPGGKSLGRKFGERAIWFG